MTAPVAVLRVMDAFVNDGAQACCGWPISFGVDEPPSCCGQTLTSEDMREASAAVAELIEAHRSAMFELATALEDYTFSATKSNSMNAALRRAESALARIGGDA